MRKIVVMVTMMLGIISSQGQTIIVKNNDGQMKIIEKQKKDSIILEVDMLLSELLIIPGSDLQKIEAIQHPNKYIVVIKKDTTIYDDYGLKAIDTKKITSIAYDGKKLTYRIILDSPSSRPAWEVYIIYLMSIVSSFLIGKQLKTKPKIDNEFGLVFGLVLVFGSGVVLVFGSGVVLVFGSGVVLVFGSGVGLVLGLVLVFGFGFGLGVGVGVGLVLVLGLVLVFGLVLELGLGLGLVFGSGVGLWNIVLITFIFIVIGGLGGYILSKKPEETQTA